MISAALAILESEEQRNELSELYKQNIKQFYSIAYSKLHNRQDAEDAIQEAFLSVAKNPDIFFSVEQGKRVSYLNVMIRNISFRIWNKNIEIEENQVEFDENIADGSISADEKIISKCDCEKIYRFINTFSETTKTALYLRTHLRMKYSDIAKQLDISEQAVKKRVSRAILKIREFMEGIDNE